VAAIVQGPVEHRGGDLLTPFDGSAQQRRRRVAAEACDERLLQGVDGGPAGVIGGGK
jgi:hypothetical protein